MNGLLSFKYNFNLILFNLFYKIYILSIFDNLLIQISKYALDMSIKLLILISSPIDEPLIYISKF